MDHNTGAVVLLIAAALYFLPTLIALIRLRTNTIAIGALNLFLGWTMIGWVIALVWSLSSAEKPRPAAESTWGTKKCHACAERIKKSALKCRYCGEAQPAR